MFLRFVGRLWENMVFERAPGWETDRIERRPEPGDGEYQLELLDEGGQVLVRVAPAVDFQRKTTIGSNEMRWADIVAYLPLRPDARELVSRRSDLVLHREDVAPDPPRIEVTGVEPSGEGRVEIHWQAEAAGNGALTFDLLYVLGRARAFYLVRGLRESSYVADLSSYPGGREVEIAVLASDGTRSAFALSGPFEVEDKPPRVLLHRPGQDEVLPADQPISLNGHATDVAGATLPSRHLVWEIDGREIGRGLDTAMATDLEPGRHELVLRYIHPEGPVGEEQITFEVAERSEEQQLFAELRAGRDFPETG